LIGIFWTRIGSPTGEADSGTLEEIERVASAGKPVMLYFSKVKQDPERIEIDQLQKLRDFKNKTFPKALVETYTTQIEFRDKFAKQIEIQVRSLLAEESSKGELESSSTTNIQLGFSDPQDGTYLGSDLALESTLLHIPDFDEIPDFTDSSVGRLQDLGLTLTTLANKSFYREFVSFIQRQSLLKPVRFWLKNLGGVGARDVYVDFRVEGDDDAKFVVYDVREARLTPPSKDGMYWHGGGVELNQPDIKLERLGLSWRGALELRALQPQREIAPPIAFVIGATRPGRISVGARIYADTIARPVAVSLSIELKTIEASKSARDVLEQAGIEVSDFGGRRSNHSPQKS
jgi:hypothetical protein